jgi:cysteine-rich repeat protein
LEAWDIVDASGDAVRVPVAGNLPISAVFGNTTCTVGGSLPCSIGAAGSTLSGLPGNSSPGLVSFLSNTYVIQADDPNPLPVMAVVRNHDLCDSPSTFGCSTLEHFTQFTASATIEPCCGNTVIETGEQCDDGNSDNLDDCRNDCMLPFCGDDILDPGESCDGTQLGDTACESCRPDCTCCGDGLVDAEENCDDGNNDNNDSCANFCGSTECFDGTVNPGEECDAGPDNSSAPCAPCRPDCTLPACGDGIADDTGCSSETCDGGDLGSTGCAFCRPDCTCCGDGVTDPGEECDDGNDVDADGCRNDCTMPPGGGEGCTPHYWKRIDRSPNNASHECHWTPPYEPETLFLSVFPACEGHTSPGLTLYGALKLGGGGVKGLARHGVAALLNAASAEVNFDLSAEAVISRVNEACADAIDLESTEDELAGLNEQFCPLGDCDRTNSVEDAESHSEPRLSRSRRSRGVRF